MTYLIWSYEHDAWWKPGRWGYTRVLGDAGQYAGVEAQQIVADANIVRVNECLVPLEDAATFRPALRALIRHEGATHDCSEWRTAAGRCDLCDRVVDGRSW